MKLLENRLAGGLMLACAFALLITAAFVPLPAQAADGSWPPIDIYARYARDDERDKSYTTAMCVLSLEIYYRYFLPLLKVH